MGNRTADVALWSGWALVITMLIGLGMVAYPRCDPCAPGFHCEGNTCHHVGYAWKPAQMMDNAMYWTNPHLRITRRCMGRNILGIPCDLQHSPRFFGFDPTRS